MTNLIIYANFLLLLLYTITIGYLADEELTKIKLTSSYSLQFRHTDENKNHVTLTHSD
jgi:hypothetical protein